MHARGVRQGSRRRHPGPRRRRIVLRHFGTRVGGGWWHAHRAGHGAVAGRPHEFGGDPVVRVAGTHVRRRHPGQGGRLPGGLREMGGAGGRHRRGDRFRPPGDHPSRRGGRRRAAAHRRPRRPGLPPADRTPCGAGCIAGQHVGQPAQAEPSRARRSGTADGGLAEPVQPRVGDRPVRPLRPRQHRARATRRCRRRARF